jgi:microcystin-dependent protein
MASDTLSPLLALTLQGAGNNPDTWGDVANANFTAIENAIAGANTITVTGGARTLNSTEARYPFIALTGVLASNSVIAVPAHAGRYSFRNGTTQGSLSVTVTIDGVGGSLTLPPGGMREIICTGSALYAVDSGAGYVPIGGVIYHNLPTATGYLRCDGSAVSRTVYAELFAVMGTAWGTGDGSTTFNLPDGGDYYIRGADAYAVGTYLSPDVLAHSHTASQTSHDHAVGVTTGTTTTVSLAADGEHRHQYTKYTNNGSATTLAGSGGSFTYQQFGTSDTSALTGFTDSGTHLHSGSTASSTSTSTVSESSRTPAVTVNASTGTETRPWSIVLHTLVRAI